MALVYLDHAATTPLDPVVQSAMAPFLAGEFGNPSSSHRLGRTAREAVEAARGKVAALLGCARDEVVFTGSASEANNTGLKGVVWAAAAARSRPVHLVTTAVEHPCVLECCAALRRYFGCEVTELAVAGDGTVDPDAVRRAIRPDTALVSVMTANNEVGTLQPVAEIARIAREAGVPFHSDAVAAAGWIEVDTLLADAALVTISGHKLYGPKGVGALKVARTVELVPLIHGGGQELGLRGGTEGVAQIVGMGEAAALTSERRRRAARRVAGLRDRLIAAVSAIDGARLTGHPARRLANHASFVFEGVDGKILLDRLGKERVIASSGSACASKKLTSSHVLRAMGLPEELAHSSLRLTLGVGTREEDIDRAVAVIEDAVASIRGATVQGAARAAAAVGG
ncbi:MAG TPA: cysteine desulfurase family protein [Kofleriaceae bacterium]|nr:cysteine desulfurase family protein [Kofleriaceae bacterium]